MSIKLCIFDMDGILLDSESGYLFSAMEVSKQHNYGVYPDLIRESMGKNHAAIVNLINERMGNGFDGEKYIQEVQEYERQYKLEHVPELMKGVPELLKFIDDNHLLKAVATSTRRQMALFRLSNRDLDKRFDYIIAGDDITKSKPDPQIYNKVIEHFKISKDEAIIFEDSMNGVLSAYNAGIRCILVPDIAMLTDEVKAKAYKEIKHIDEAIAIIKEENNI